MRKTFLGLALAGAALASQAGIVGDVQVDYGNGVIGVLQAGAANLCWKSQGPATVPIYGICYTPVNEGTGTPLYDTTNSAFRSLAAGTNISITNSSGVLTIASAAGGFTSASTEGASGSYPIYDSTNSTSTSLVFKNISGAGTVSVGSDGSGGLVITGTGGSTGGGTGGTVSSVSASGGSPVFSETVSNASTTPSIVFTISSAGANTILGNCTASSLAPVYATLSTCLASAYGTTTGAFLYYGASGFAESVGNSSATRQYLTEASGVPAFGTIPSVDIATALQTAPQIIDSTAGAASAPAVLVNGTLYTGGTATTNSPLVEIGQVAGTNWSTAGTELGIDAVSGCTGNLIDAQVNNSSFFKLSCYGTLVLGGALTTSGLTPLKGTATLAPIRLTPASSVLLTTLSAGALEMDASGDFFGTDNASTLLRHRIFSANTPTIAAGTGAGSTPTVSVTGNDSEMTVNVTTGTSPTPSAVVATLTFNTAFYAAPHAICMPHNAATGLLTGTTAVWPGAESTTSFTLNEESGGLAASTAYQWNCFVRG